MAKARRHPLVSPDCIVKVGDGRGFLSEYRAHPRSVVSSSQHLRLRRFIDRSVIVTAAHCLPNLPPAHAGALQEERTYKDLLGSLDGSKKHIWAECLFVDPVADIAILDSPDEQAFDEQADAYHSL